MRANDAGHGEIVQTRSEWHLRDQRSQWPENAHSNVGERPMQASAGWPLIDSMFGSGQPSLAPQSIEPTSMIAPCLPVVDERNARRTGRPDTWLGLRFANINTWLGCNSLTSIPAGSLPHAQRGSSACAKCDVVSQNVPAHTEIAFDAADCDSVGCRRTFRYTSRSECSETSGNRK